MESASQYYPKSYPNKVTVVFTGLWIPSAPAAYTATSTSHHSNPWKESRFHLCQSSQIVDQHQLVGRFGTLQREHIQSQRWNTHLQFWPKRPGSFCRSVFAPSKGWWEENMNRMMFFSNQHSIFSAKFSWRHVSRFKMNNSSASNQRP